MHTCSINLPKYAYNTAIGDVKFCIVSQMNKTRFFFFRDYSVYSFFGIRSLKRTLERAAYQLSELFGHYVFERLNARTLERSIRR